MDFLRTRIVGTPDVGDTTAGDHVGISRLSRTTNDSQSQLPHLVDVRLKRVRVERGGLRDDNVVYDRRAHVTKGQIGNQSEVLIVHASRA